jgi:hypothetical protein
VSAAWPIDVAVAAAFIADGTLAALLAGDRVYSLVAPKDSAFDYLVLGDGPEEQFRTFGRQGHTNDLAVHIWSQGRAKQGVLTIYDSIERILDRHTLALTNPQNTMVRMATRLQAVLVEPDGVTFHGVARVSVLSFVG